MFRNHTLLRTYSAIHKKTNHSLSTSISTRIKSTITLSNRNIHLIKAQIPQKKHDALKISSSTLSNLFKALNITPTHLPNLITPTLKINTAWEKETVIQCNFAIKNKTVTFSPESRSYLANENFLKLSIACAFLMEPTILSGKRHQFSSILIQYSNFGKSNYENFHNDSFIESCIMDVSNSQDSITELLYTLDNISIPFLKRDHHEAILFPQKKQCSIQSLGIDLDTINTLIIETNQNLKEISKDTHKNEFYHHLTSLKSKKTQLGFVLHRGIGGPRTILNVSKDLPGKGWWDIQESKKKLSGGGDRN